MTATPLRHELLPALLATIVLALAYVAMIVNSDREQRQKVIADSLADDAWASLSQVEKFFARQEAVLMTVAESRCVRDRLAVLCGEYFPRLLTRFPEAVNFAAADREGMIFASSRLFDPQRPPTTRHLPFFKTLADGRSATIMDPHTGPLSGEPVVGIAIALRDQNGHFAGVVGVTIDFDRLKRLWREDARESRHQLAVVDGSQRLIFASGPFAEQRDQPATVLDPVLNHEGADRVSIAGQDFVTHTRFLRGGEWKIVALTPTSSVLDQYLSGNPMLVALLLPLLFLGALGLLSRRREQQAVSLLVTSEERLHSAQEVLESTVAERTRELSGSEQRLRLLLDSTVEAIIGIGLDGCCTFCNPAALRMLGWNSEQDLLGSELHSLTHYRKADGSPYPPDQCPTHQVLRTGVAVSTDDELFFRADRTSFPVRYSAHPIIREGTVAGAVLTFLDISKHKLAEQKLSEIQKAQAFLSRCGYLDPQENFFAQLARYLAQALGMDYVCIDSLEGDCLHARTEAIYFDGTFEDNVSYALHDTPCGDTLGQEVCCFEKDVRHLFPRDEVLQQMVAESYVGCTLWGFDGTPIGLIAIIGRQPLGNPQLAETLLRLVAVRAAGELERQRSNQELRNQQTHLEHLVQQRTAELSEALDAARLADRAKDQFLANVSHELRTPLNAVIGLAHLARRLGSDPLQQDYLDKIGKAGKSLAHLINDLLDLTKIVAGRLTFENTTFSLRGMCERSESMIMHKAHEKGLELVRRVDDEVPDILVGDPLRIEQILLNLLGNAIKFTNTGRIEVRIGLAARDETRVCLAIEVEDSGIGLGEEEIARLFKPFAQTDASMTRKYGGTGLGLAICKRLAELMAGEISVSGRPGAGSTFRVTLWLALGKVDTLHAAREPVDLEELPARYHQARVLVVEDQPLNREIVAALLGEVGITPVMTGNGQEAIDLLGEIGPRAVDLVLMDIQMPLLDGLSATRELRRRAGFEALPIIAMTAHTMEHEKDICAAAGMNDFIGKPLDSHLFYRTLARWIPHSKHLATTQMPATSGTSLPATCNPPLAGPDWAALNKIDTAAGLARLSGNEARYRHWLQDFAEHGLVSVSAIRQAIAAGDGSQARQLAHALAGRVGMLGMAEAHALAKRVESAASHNGDAAESLDDLEQAICAVGQQIVEWLTGCPQGAEDPPMFVPLPAAMPSPAGPRPPPIVALLRLLKIADGGSAQAIEDCIEEFGETPWSPLLHAALTQVRRFDFEAACRLFAYHQTTTHRRHHENHPPDR